MRFGAVGFLAPILLGGLASAGEAELPDPPVISAPVTSFDPVDDAFSFGNGLRWEYDTSFAHPDAPPAPPPGDYDQRCSQMSRAARQFFRNARFEPDRPKLGDRTELERRVRDVMKSDARRREASEDPILFPGYAHLREFSAENEALLKDSIGGRWRAYFQRGNWRMIFHYSDRHQAKTARQLLADLAADHPPIVHLVRFPKITINHTMMLHRAVETSVGIDFYAYDPNHPGLEIAMHFDRALSEFRLQPTFYWPGGRVIAYEVYDEWLH